MPLTDEGYFEIELTPKQYGLIAAWVTGRNHLLDSGDKQSLIEALKMSRRINAPLTRERFDWKLVSELAHRQGVSEAEIVWDLCRPPKDA